MSYDPNRPGAGLSGPSTPPTRPMKVRFQAKAGAPPGMPGFFAWLASEATSSPAHRDLYNHLRVTLPNVVEDRQGTMAEGSIVSGLGDAASDAITASINAFDAASGQASTEGITNSVPMPTTSGLQQIVSTIASAVPTFLSLSNDQKLLNVQLQRAVNGQQPLDLSKYTVSTGGLNLGLNPSTQNMVLLLGGGIAAVWLLSSVLGRKRA